MFFFIYRHHCAIKSAKDKKNQELSRSHSFEAMVTLDNMRTQHINCLELMAENLPGAKNEIADEESRTMQSSAE